MPDKVDYYALLFVAPSADIEIIKAAYRVLAKRYHPDAGKDSTSDSIARFRLIQEAFDVLADPKARAEYDSARASNTGDFAQTSNGIHLEKLHRDPSLWTAVLVVAAFVLFVWYQIHP
jgi:curved DNA-binding protein CbpA